MIAKKILNGLSQRPSICRDRLKYSWAQYLSNFWMKWQMMDEVVLPYQMPLHLEQKREEAKLYTNSHQHFLKSFANNTHLGNLKLRMKRIETQRFLMAIMHLQWKCCLQVKIAPTFHKLCSQIDQLLLNSPRVPMSLRLITQMLANMLMAKLSVDKARIKVF